jgi:streptogramin lyase
VPGDANGIAIAEGVIWVTLEAPEGAAPGVGTVARLDADTGRRLPPVELPRPPTGVRSGLGAVWVTTYRPDEFAVYRIDPRNATVTRVPRAQAVLAAGAGALWVTTDNPPTAIHRIDPGSGRVVATLPDPEVRRMAFGSGALWALTDARLYRVDPNSARVVGAPVALPQDSSGALAVGEGGIWVAEPGTETAITRLNLTP